MQKPRNQKRWTEEDLKFIWDNHKTMSIEQLAKHFGRTVKATSSKLHRHGFSYFSESSKGS